MTEFDFAREGWALQEIGEKVNAKYGPSVHVPKPHRELCRRRVCVMERLDGYVKLVDGLQHYFNTLAKQQGVTAKELMKKMEQEGATHNISSAQIDAVKIMMIFCLLLLFSFALFLVS
jgi:predicted unusual protein kinase regulating ubiquinone biosynthesis (AarF/ABC1/UbiB family)